jgi:competence protein ComEC
LGIGASATRLEVDFFDVGQGDAALIRSPYGQNILIDGGPNQRAAQELEKILPLYDRTIDLVLLTHPHDDHAAGLVPVLENFKVEKIAYTGVVHTAPAYLELLKIIKAQKISLLIIDRPQKIVLGEACFLDIIYPQKSFLQKSTGNLNNSSLVINLDCENKKILFMGDAEAEVEEELIASGMLSDIDIIKIGHHGSDTSSTWDFLKLLDPEKAIISVGKDNKFGHPSLRVIRRLERIGAEVIRTDLAGTIKL